ncbi:hypothetical protein AB0D24_29840 [Streptomyces javensis]
MPAHGLQPRRDRVRDLLELPLHTPLRPQSRHPPPDQGGHLHPALLLAPPRFEP